MNSYGGYDLDDNPLVQAIGKLQFTGNLVARSWFHYLRKPTGKPDLLAIMLLAEIVYWYRPIQGTDHETGLPLPWRKKFKEQLLRVDYQKLADRFGFSYDQVQRAVTFLRNKGLLHIRLRAHPNGTYVYLELIVDRVEQISVVPQGVTEETVWEEFSAGGIERVDVAVALDFTQRPSTHQTHPANLQGPPTPQVCKVGTHPANLRRRHPANLPGHKEDKISGITKISKTTEIPPTPLAETNNQTDGVVVKENLGGAVAPKVFPFADLVDAELLSGQGRMTSENFLLVVQTQGALALQPTFEELRCETKTDSAALVEMSGMGGDEPSPAQSPSNRIVRLAHQNHQLATILPEAVQAIVHWTIETVGCSVSQREIQTLLELCRDEKYSFAELTACYLAHKAPGSRWNRPSWQSVKSDIARFASLYRAVADATTKLPDLSVLVNALGWEWAKLALADQHAWAVAVQQFGWDSAQASVFLAHFHQTLKGQKGFAPTVADLCDHWQRALATQTTTARLTDVQQSLVAQLEAHGITPAQAVELVLQDETEVGTQLAALPYRDRGAIESLSGWLIKAIRHRYSVPSSLTTYLARMEANQEAERLKREQEAQQEAHWLANRTGYFAYLEQCALLLQLQNPCDWTAFQATNPTGTMADHWGEFWKFFDLRPQVALQVLHFLEWDQTVIAGEDPIRYRQVTVPAPVLASQSVALVKDWHPQQEPSQEAYYSYVRERVDTMQTADPVEYAAFIADSAKQRDCIKTFKRMVEAFDEPKGQWDRFVQYFQTLPLSVPVLTWTQWREACG